MNNLEAIIFVTSKHNFSNQMNVMQLVCYETLYFQIFYSTMDLQSCSLKSNLLLLNLYFGANCAVMKVTTFGIGSECAGGG